MYVVQIDNEDCVLGVTSYLICYGLVLGCLLHTCMIGKNKNLSPKKLLKLFKIKEQFLIH